MGSTRPESGRICTFQHYTLAWEVGTGLQVSLAPGEYVVTGEEQNNGILYLRLNDSYRIDASKLNG